MLGAGGVGGTGNERTGSEDPRGEEILGGPTLSLIRLDIPPPRPPPTMKAISPVRSVRSCYEAVCCLSEQSLAIARSSNNKSPALEEPMNLLYDMNDCYSKLRELVPGIPQGTKLSQVEILQHVIDYIFDLQIVLEEGAKGRDHSSEATLLSLKVWGCFFLLGSGLRGGSDGKGLSGCCHSPDPVPAFCRQPSWPPSCAPKTREVCVTNASSIR